MCAAVGGASMTEMSTRVIGWPILGVLVAAVIGAGAIAISAGQNRSAVLATLARPAIPAKTTSFNVRDGGYSVVVRMSPNRASTTNWLNVKLSRHGRLAAIARTHVAFSMPAMNMWNGFTSRLSARDGAMAGAIPVLGMAGVWQLRLTIADAGGHRLVAVVNDRLSS
jgi:hypothetical protein